MSLEKLEEMREFAATTVCLLRELHEIFGWDGLSHTIEDVLEAAVALDVICEDDLDD